MKIKISNETYDVLLAVATYVLPAVGTLYFALASIWGLPFGEEIVGTITAVDAFMGAVIKAAKNGYQEEE